jgi:hypothetical protein
MTAIIAGSGSSRRAVTRGLVSASGYIGSKGHKSTNKRSVKHQDNADCERFKKEMENRDFFRDTRAIVVYLLFNYGV